MLEDLKKRVYEANLELVRNGLVIYTWGNVSGFDRESGLVVIKPSGVSYETMKPEDMVVVDLDGNIVDGTLRPSSDTPTHLELYKAFPELGGVAHTHSTYATGFAQAQRSIPAFGTTHADYFYGDIPCCRPLTPEETAGAYEKNTGLSIVEAMQGLSALEIPGALTSFHGPFAWGNSPEKAAYHATVLEKLAELAFLTLQLSGNEPALPQHILDKHYQRKHGKNAYYGQNSGKQPK